LRYIIIFLAILGLGPAAVSVEMSCNTFLTNSLPFVPKIKEKHPLSAVSKTVAYLEFKKEGHLLAS